MAAVAADLFCPRFKRLRIVGRLFTLENARFCFLRMRDFALAFELWK